MQGDYTTNSRYNTHTIAFWKVRRIHFLSLGAKGLITMIWTGLYVHAILFIHISYFVVCIIVAYSSNTYSICRYCRVRAIQGSVFTYSEYSTVAYCADHYGFSKLCSQVQYSTWERRLDWRWWSTAACNDKKTDKKIMINVIIPEHHSPHLFLHPFPLLDKFCRAFSSPCHTLHQRCGCTMTNSKRETPESTKCQNSQLVT